MLAGGGLFLTNMSVGLIDGGGLGRLRCVNLSLLRRPLLAVAIILTALTGLAFVVSGIAALVANSRTFGLGVGAMLIGYGALLILIAWLVLRGRSWALGLIVASSLLHALAVGSFLTSQDRTQFVLMLVIAPFVLATLVASVLAVGRGELQRATDSTAS